MLTPGAAGGDGRKAAYLSEPGRWRRFDPPLYDALRDAVAVRGERSVAVAGEPAILGPVPTFARPVPDDAGAYAFRMPHVAFFLLAQERHRAFVSGAAEVVARTWTPHITLAHRCVRAAEERTAARPDDRTA